MNEDQLQDQGESQTDFSCARCARPSGQLDAAPFKGPLGETIRAKICDACWNEWVPMGTKVVNELGLVLASDAGRDTYDQYMIEFLQLEDHQEGV